MALMYLSGYLKKNGEDTRIIDETLKDQIRDKKFVTNRSNLLNLITDSIISRVKDLPTDIIGITCYTPEIYEVEQLAKKIRIVKPDATIIVGGIHPTLYPQDLLGPDSLIDFVVVGEGELTLLELVRAIRSGKSDYSCIDGIGFFDKSSLRIVVTKNRPLVKDLDEISDPDYRDLDMNFYTTASPYAIRGVFSRSFYISSSRGCPSSCSFCVSKKLREHHGIKQFVRLRSPESLYNEIKTLSEKFAIDAFYFIDDLFTLKKENVFAFCELLVKNRSHLVWGCSSKVNTVDYAMLKAMRLAGCVQIDFGVEKGSDEALRALKKGTTIAQIKDTFNNCHHLGIRTFANLLVNTPGETEEDLGDIITLIKSIKPNIISINVFTPYPGCEIFDEACFSLKREDYPRLMGDPAKLMAADPQKFKFAKHAINLGQWGPKTMKKYNKIIPNLAIYFDLKYIKCLIFSKRKIDYVRQFQFLIKEFILQKF
ncbi:MAG: hypothetical protein AUJ74_06220 [Candidatus Omnitrophica bacterium CG1_02_44_16]|nr:MAG: hypothetical protein AUJ74_06220 [Candidatus Omnitrophica bacterium CG1_02_44_16]